VRISWPLPWGQTPAPRIARRPTSAQTTPQLTRQRSTPLDVQAEVDGRMRDPHRGVVGIGQGQPAHDLLNQLPQHRGWRPTQPPGDRPAGVASGHPTAEHFPLDRRQGAGRALGWPLLHATGLQHKPSDRGSRLPMRRAINRSDSPCRHRAHSFSCSSKAPRRSWLVLRPTGSAPWRAERAGSGSIRVGEVLPGRHGHLLRGGQQPNEKRPCPVCRLVAIRSRNGQD
jgi:hypothetical protein